MGAFLAPAAIAGYAALAGQGIQTAGAAARNKKQYFNQKKLMDYSQTLNQSMALFNNDQQLKMWKETGPVGAMEQLNKAGLNPGLMYGMGGPGGQTAAATPAQGVGTPSADVENVAGGMGITGQVIGEQLALLKSQKANIDADTQNKQADAANKTADTANKPLQGENIKADTALKQTNNKIAEIDRQIKSDTQIDVTDQITNTARQATEELQKLVAERTLTEEQAVNARQLATQQLLKLQLENDNLQKQLQLTDKQIEQIANAIKNDNTRVDIEKKVKDITGSEELVGKIIGNIMGIITHGIIK